MNSFNPYSHTTTARLLATVAKILAMNAIRPFETVCHNSDGSAVATLSSAEHAFTLHIGPTVEISWTRDHDGEPKPFVFDDNDFDLPGDMLGFLRDNFADPLGRIVHGVTEDAYGNTISMLQFADGTAMKLTHVPFTPREDAPNAPISRYRVRDGQRYIDLLHVGATSANPKTELRIGPVTIFWENGKMLSIDPRTAEMDHVANPVIELIDRTSIETENLERAILTVVKAVREDGNAWIVPAAQGHVRKRTQRHTRPAA